MFHGFNSNTRELPEKYSIQPFQVSLKAEYPHYFRLNSHFWFNLCTFQGQTTAPSIIFVSNTTQHHSLESRSISFYIFFPDSKRPDVIFMMLFPLLSPRPLFCSRIPKRIPIFWQRSSILSQAELSCLTFDFVVAGNFVSARHLAQKCNTSPYVAHHKYAQSHTRTQVPLPLSVPGEELMTHVRSHFASACSSPGFQRKRIEASVVGAV